jgi:hypothetical protein
MKIEKTESYTLQAISRKEVSCILRGHVCGEGGVVIR